MLYFNIERMVTMCNQKMLLNVTHVKNYIKERQKLVRPGWKFDYVSAEAINDINERVKRLIDSSLTKHPSKGKTFTQIM